MVVFQIEPKGMVDYVTIFVCSMKQKILVKRANERGFNEWLQFFFSLLMSEWIRIKMIGCKLIRFRVFCMSQYLMELKIPRIVITNEMKSKKNN